MSTSILLFILVTYFLRKPLSSHRHTRSLYGRAANENAATADAASDAVAAATDPNIYATASSVPA